MSDGHSIPSRAAVSMHVYDATITTFATGTTMTPLPISTFATGSSEGPLSEHLVEAFRRLHAAAVNLMEAWS